MSPLREAILGASLLCVPTVVLSTPVGHQSPHLASDARGRGAHISSSLLKAYGRGKVPRTHKTADKKGDNSPSSSSSPRLLGFLRELIKTILGEMSSEDEGGL